MSLFEDALAASRDAVSATYAVPMTVTPMVTSNYGAAHPDPNRAAFVGVPGVLHEHVIGAGGQSKQTALVERSDGGRPGGRFGFDLAGAPTRISFDLVDLGGWVPPEGTRISIDGTDRVFRVVQPAPVNGGRITLFVTTG